MSYRNTTFYPLGNTSGRDHSSAIYIYRTDDTLAEITANGYFADIASRLSMGDIIKVEFVDFVSSTDDIFTAKRGVAKLVVGYNLNGILTVVSVDPNADVLFGTMTDLSTAGTAIGGGAATDGNLDIITNSKGNVVKVTTILGGTITTGDAAITIGNQTDGVTFQGGAITVANAASAKGDIDTSNPTGANLVTATNTIRVVSDGGSTVAQNLFIILEFVPSSLNKIYLTGQITDVSAAGLVYFASPVVGDVTKITTVLEGAISAGDAAITSEIGGVAITGGALTVANAASAAGDVDTATPTAANTVAVGSDISVITDGGSTDVQRLFVTIEITPAI